MKDQYLVEATEAAYHLDEHLPNILFFEEGITLLVIAYLLEQIAEICVLHDYTTQILSM